MRYDKKAGIIALTALTILMLANSLYITPLVISDTDPSTYIIVPILMLPLFAVFTMKEEMQPKIGRRDIAIGTALFALAALLTIYLRLQFSYLFLDFGIEMLLFPFFLAAIAILLFGLRNLSHFKYLLLYSLFASPAILIFLTSLNKPFAIANTLLIFSVVKLLFAHAAYIHPITISANGYTAGIGETCVGIGILIATIFFLAPIAYLYKGGRYKKFIWVLSGFVLLLILNTLRMLFISLDWFASGPSSALLGIHLFAGVILFYIVIIVMILLTGRYGLTMPIEKPTKKKIKVQNSGLYKYGVVASVILGIIYYLLTLNYANATVTSPTLIYSHAVLNFSSMQGNDLINATTSPKGYVWLITRGANQTYVSIDVANGSIGEIHPIQIVLSSTKQYLPNLNVSNTILLGSMSFLDNTSQVERLYYLESEGNKYFLYNKVFPYVLENNTATTIDEYVLVPVGAIAGSETCSQYYDGLYTTAFNIAGIYNASTNAYMMNAYCKVQRLVG